MYAVEVPYVMLVSCADGRYLVCGSEDGRVVIWDADGGPPTLLPHFTLGGDTAYQVRPAGEEHEDQEGAAVTCHQ